MMNDIGNDIGEWMAECYVVAMDYNALGREFV